MNSQMVPKVLAMVDSFDPQPERWEAMARENHAELIVCSAQSHKEFLEYFEDANNNIVAIANSWWGTKKMGGYTPELIREIGKKAKSLRAICHLGAGYELVGDIDAWKAAIPSIQISNTPDAVAGPTADTAIFLLIAAMRNFYPLAKTLREGKWMSSDAPLGRDPKNRVLGILGMGNIGRLIRDRAVPLGFKSILYHTRTRLSPELERDSKYVATKEELLSSCDVIVIAVPMNKYTVHLVDAEALSMCKRGVIIVNIARGPVVDESALVDALNSGQVYSAGLDVFEHEPEVHPGLLENERVMLLPHVGMFTDNAVYDTETDRMANVASFLQTGKVLNIVPELRETGEPAIPSRDIGKAPDVAHPFEVRT